MQLKTVIKKGGIRIKIPNSRNELPELFKSLGFTIGVEIGVYKGEFTRRFAEAGLKIYGVDPWKVYGDYDVKYRKHGPTQTRQDFLYGHAQRYLKDYPNCTLIRKTSMEAVNDFNDESLDFVYIDGHHGLKYVVEDLWEWSKKIRKGGIISGHDYMVTYAHNPLDPYVCHVKNAVNAHVATFRIQNWFILTGDAWPSYLWKKQ